MAESRKEYLSFVSSTDDLRRDILHLRETIAIEREACSRDPHSREKQFFLCAKLNLLYELEQRLASQLAKSKTRA